LEKFTFAVVSHMLYCPCYSLLYILLSHIYTAESVIHFPYLSLLLLTVILCLVNIFIKIKFMS